MRPGKNVRRQVCERSKPSVERMTGTAKKAYTRVLHVTLLSRETIDSVLGADNERHNEARLVDLLGGTSE